MKSKNGFKVGDIVYDTSTYTGIKRVGDKLVWEHGKVKIISLTDRVHVRSLNNAYALYWLDFSQIAKIT